MGTKAVSTTDEDSAQKLRNRETEIALLSETAQVVNSELDLKTVFQLVTQRAQALIQAETVLIPLLDEDCQHYTYRAGFGKNTEEIVGESLPLDFGVCGWVWRHKRPWWRGVLDELNDEEKNKWEKEAGTLILVPLFGKRHFLGGIVGINKIGGGDFSKRDLDLLTLFASQVSIAIENATFFEEINRAKKQAEVHQQELQALNADLERRVHGRTAELAAANIKLKALALHDTLTGLPNRALIHDRLKYSIARAKRESQPLSIMMLDLDRFKEINDTLGHHIGDQFLIAIADRLRAVLRETDTVGRLGGDEFTIILPGTHGESAVGVAAKIIEALEKPLELAGNHLSPAGSLGIAMYPDHGQDENELLKFADAAMYTAKRAHGGYFVYDAKADDQHHEQLSLVSELRAAIRKNQFELFYQPQIDLLTGKVLRVEALARWPHPEKGMIPPDVFIPILEKTGLINLFTHWVLDTALGQFAAWRDAGPQAGPNTSFTGMTLGVNLSMHNLSNPSLPDQLAALLSKWDVDGSSLILEITEASIIKDPDRVIGVLSRLRETGVKFSVDDFGACYASMAYLKKLPISEIKIDKAFVMQITNEDEAIVVLSTIYLAHNLGLEVVAEGVETQAVLDALVQLKCNSAQGYHISRPLPADELMAFLRTTEMALSMKN